MSKRWKAWLIGVLVAIVVLFGPGFIQQAQLAWQQWTVDRRLRTLEARHQELVAEHRRLQEDATYVEGLIRSTFKLAKPGELVIPLESEPSSDR